MYGTLPGKADSASATLLGVFAHSPTFDPAAVAQLLTDQDDRRAEALFTAMLRGALVISIAVAALGGPGDDVAIFYDNADAFPASFARRQQAFAPSATVEIGLRTTASTKPTSRPKQCRCELGRSRRHCRPGRRGADRCWTWAARWPTSWRAHRSTVSPCLGRLR